MIYLIVLIASLLAILFSAEYNRDFNTNYLSRENTNNLKGIAAILILLHHISIFTDVYKWLYGMRYIGFILVSVFFFSSGYGLMYGLNNKKDYLSGFFRKRIFPVLRIYWLLDIIAIAYYWIKGKVFKPYEYVLSIIGIDTAFLCWFVGSIVILYIGFYISFKLSKQYGYYILLVYLLLYCVIFSYSGLNNYYTSSIATFMLGVVWEKLNFDKWISKGYWLKVVCFAMSFLFAFAGRLYLASIGLNMDWLHIILRNIISVLFMFFVLAVSKKVSFKGPIVKWLGDISYELYLGQTLCMLLLLDKPDTIYIIGVFFGSLLLAHLLKTLSVLTSKAK